MEGEGRGEGEEEGQEEGEWRATEGNGGQVEGKVNGERSQRRSMATASPRDKGGTTAGTSKNLSKLPESVKTTLLISPSRASRLDTALLGLILLSGTATRTVLVSGGVACLVVAGW